MCCDIVKYYPWVPFSHLSMYIFIFYSEEEYSLLSNMSEASRVDENSNEFSDIVKNFYETIREYHNKIKIIKVRIYLHAL